MKLWVHTAILSIKTLCLGTRIPSSRTIVQYKTMVLYTVFVPVYKTMVLYTGGLMLSKNRYDSALSSTLSVLLHVLNMNI